METLVTEISAYEFERGKPMPSLNNSIVQSSLIMELGSRYRKRFRLMSEININVGPEFRVMVPDVGIFPKMDANMADDSIVAPVLPITTIEILSPAQALSELIGKANFYFQVGIKSCWIVLPEASGVFVYGAPGKYSFFHAEETLIDPVTGIELPLAPLFE